MSTQHPKLCRIVHASDPRNEFGATVLVQDSTLPMEAHVMPFDHSHQPTSMQESGVLDLQSLVQKRSVQGLWGTVRLSRTDRFSIATALTWGGLRLCDSLRLEKNLSGATVCSFLGKDNQALHPRVTGHPFLAATFPVVAAQSDPVQQAQENIPGSQYLKSQIKSRPLYTLAFRLIELSLNRDFEELS